jgi:tripartite-type tricarboxylate transporter receptor subunit TctC
MSRVVSVCLALVIASGTAGFATAQPVFPTKPIRIVVPYPPGGANDVISRVIAEGLTRSLRQQTNIDNRGGAGGMIGTQLVAEAPPDGHTLLFTSAAHAINPAIYKTVPYDSVSSFEMLTQVAEGSFVLLMHPAIPAQSIKDLVALAKRRPGQLIFASAGIGNATHLAGELFRLQTGTDLVHVPYKGGGPVLIDLLSGQVSMYFGTLTAGLPYINAKRLKPMAVTAKTRSSLLPNVPTIAESGYKDYEVAAWWLMMAPKGTSPGIVTIINQEIVRHLKSKDSRDTLQKQGVEPVGSTPQQANAFLQKEISKWREVVRQAGVAVQ